MHIKLNRNGMISARINSYIIRIPYSKSKKNNRNLHHRQKCENKSIVKMNMEMKVSTTTNKRHEKITTNGIHLVCICVIIHAM